jgi:3-isopropylmalate/(R)-2-methylmalate dehydratase large subunit
VNIAEKILAAHSGKKTLTPGEFINARVDVVLSNDITAPIAIREFRRLGVPKVFDPSSTLFYRSRESSCPGMLLSGRIPIPVPTAP